LVSVVGRDYPEEYLAWLSRCGLDLAGVRRSVSKPTTQYSIDFTGGARKLRLLSKCDPIAADRIVETRGDAIFLSPVAHETSIRDIPVASRRSEKVALDPQGMLRDFGTDGTVSLKPTDLGEGLKGLWFLHVSREELEVLTGSAEPVEGCRMLHERGVGIVQVGLHERGVLLSAGDERWIIPVIHAKTLDTVGAGDILAGATIAALLLGSELTEAAALAMAMVSDAATSLGPASIPRKDQVLERADELERLARRL